jgi:hypothetical protein
MFCSVGRIQLFQGSILWSQYSAICPNFRRKIGVFLKYQCYDQFFQNLALFWVKNAHFFAKFFGENIFFNHNIGPRQWYCRSVMVHPPMFPQWKLENLFWSLFVRLCCWGPKLCSCFAPSTEFDNNNKEL